MKHSAVPKTSSRTAKSNGRKAKEEKLRRIVRPKLKGQSLAESLAFWLLHMSRQKGSQIEEAVQLGLELFPTLPDNNREVHILFMKLKHHAMQIHNGVPKPDWTKESLPCTLCALGINKAESIKTVRKYPNGCRCHYACQIGMERRIKMTFQSYERRTENLAKVSVVRTVNTEERNLPAGLM